MSEHQDRRISLREIALLVTIFVTVSVNIGSVSWFAATVKANQSFTQHTLSEVRDDVKGAANAVQQAITAGAVQKEQIISILDRLTRLEARR